MLRKNNTIKVRITLLSFLIIIFTVLSIMLTEYLLQRSVNAVTIDMSNIVELPDPQSQNTDNATRMIIAQTKEQLQKQQQIKFFWLVTISTIILSIGIALIYYVIKKELAPLDNLKNDMDQMDFHTIEKKLLIPTSNTNEIVSLTDSYNLMISKLKEAYALQKRFNQNAAHELKTPITTMKTTLQVNRMVHPNVDEETDALLTVFEDQINRMENLVASLLLLNSQKQLSNETVSVRKEVQEILQTFQDQINQKHLIIEIEGDLNIKTDRSLLYIILKNILENAIRYNNDNGSITINLHNHIRISDTGLGISTEEQERIFSPFYCVDDSRSKQFGGLGLGLSIVKDGIAQLGYELQLTSNLNEGTTFTILFDESIQDIGEKQ